MKNFKELDPVDKKKLMQESYHMTRPPRMEGKVKNAMMNPVKKQKQGKSMKIKFK